jgi:hypothetical protein
MNLEKPIKGLSLLFTATVFLSQKQVNAFSQRCEIKKSSTVSIPFPCGASLMQC